jgi:hypothetical protein
MHAEMYLRFSTQMSISMPIGSRATVRTGSAEFDLVGVGPARDNVGEGSSRRHRGQAIDRGVQAVVVHRSAEGPVAPSFMSALAWPGHPAPSSASLCPPTIGGLGC